MSKLGIQTQRLDREVLNFCLRAKVGVFKSIAPQPTDLLRELKAALPDCIFIYRWMGGQPLDNPVRNAREAYDGMMPHLAEFPYDYAEAYNETGLWNEGPAYNEFTVQLAGLLHQTGQKLLAYSFSVGNPPGYASFRYEEDPAEWMNELGRYWQVYWEGLLASDGLALHQYKLPSEEDKFTLLRHRLVQEVIPLHALPKPLFLTEFGLDDVANPGESGWRGSSWNWTAERYARWIVETWRKIKHEVAGASIFVCGGKGWESFEILDQPVIADAIRQANEEEEEMVLPVNDVRAVLARHATKRFARRPLDRVNGLVIHHSAIKAPVTPRNLASAFVRLGYPGMAYHFYITQDGIAHLCLDLEEEGGHCYNHNDHTWGICVAGRCVSGAVPTPNEIETLSELVTAIQREYPRVANIWGHRELRATVCPGGPWFEKWRRGLIEPPAEDYEAMYFRLRAKMAQARELAGIAEDRMSPLQDAVNDLGESVMDLGEVLRDA